LVYFNFNFSDRRKSDVNMCLALSGIFKILNNAIVWDMYNSCNNGNSFYSKSALRLPHLVPFDDYKHSTDKLVGCCKDGRCSQTAPGSLMDLRLRIAATPVLQESGCSTKDVWACACSYRYFGHQCAAARLIASQAA
jgi:hypothetical protein